jgi:membrane associated rhomboid family serine protease
VTGSASGVAHFAHLGGLLGGWMVMRYWRGQPPFGGRRRKSRKPGAGENRLEF